MSLCHSGDRRPWLMSLRQQAATRVMALQNLSGLVGEQQCA